MSAGSVRGRGFIQHTPEFFQGRLAVAGIKSVMGICNQLYAPGMFNFHPGICAGGRFFNVHKSCLWHRPVDS